MYPFNYTLPFANMPARRVRLTKEIEVPIFKRNNKGEFVLNDEGERIQLGTDKRIEFLDIRIPKREKEVTPIPETKYGWFRSRPYMWEQRGVTGITSAHIRF